MTEFYSNRYYQDRFSRSYGENKRKSYRGVGPRGYRRPDSSILDEVCERITRHGFVDGSEIDVQVHHGEVILSGMVENRAMKRLVEDIIEDISGVIDIHNRLTLRGARRIG